jgi:hypothetical protein
MPIRINLLAEAQAAEDVRRRDPVKRSLYVASALIVMILVWISSLQVKIMTDNGRLSNLEAGLSSRTNQYTKILANKETLIDVSAKLASLNYLSANRFLQATLLNALMHAPVEGIQITQLHTDQGYEVLPRIEAVVERGKTITPARPAGALQRVKLILEGKDTSANPGSEQINKFRETLAHTKYFECQQISTNNILLKNLSSPQLDTESGKPYVLFTLECSYPDKVR